MDRVSCETAVRLRNAGLVWQPAVGDWVYGRCSRAGKHWNPDLWKGVGTIVLAEQPDDDDPEVRLMISKVTPPPFSTDKGWSAYFAPSELVWLPSTGQLLAVFRAEHPAGILALVDTFTDGRVYAQVRWHGDNHEWVHTHACGSSEVEALADAWLRVREVQP